MHGCLLRYLLLMLATIASGRLAAAAIACTISSTGLSFGNYNPVATGTPSASVGTITVTCIGLPGDTTTYTISITAGNGTVASRYMADVTSRLSYGLYLDSACTVAWGDNTNGTSTKTDFVTIGLVASVKNYSVYGCATGRQNEVAGLYTDVAPISVKY